MQLCEFIKRKLFLHKNIKITELNDADLLNMFKEEVSNEIGVIDKKKNDLKEENNEIF